MKRILTLALTALLLTIGVSSAAHASSFALTLDAPIQTANPGDTVYFTGNLQVFNQIFLQDNPPIFLNADTFSNDAPLILDDSYFFFTFSPSINAGESEDNILFAVTLPYDIPTGTYFGSFTVLGGTDSDTFDPIGSDNFSISTVAVPSSVPEPSSLLLLGTGLFGAVAAFKRRSAHQV